VYEDMTPDERSKMRLPRHFSPYHYRLIDSFCKDRPNVNPPHVHDSSDPNNNQNFLPDHVPPTDMDTEEHYQDPINLYGPSKQSVSRRGLQSSNTGLKKRQDPKKRKLLEITQANGVSLVAALNQNMDMNRELSDMLSTI
jgi:hypothetical protein